MTRIARGAIGLSILLLVACGNESFLLPGRKDVSDFEIKSATDGLVVLPGDTIPLSIAASDGSKTKDLEVQVVLYSTANTKAWDTRLTVPALNEPLPPLKPSGLAPGQYRMEITLLSSGDELTKKTSMVFFSGAQMGIMGIKSFPAVITPASAVLLDSQLSSGTDANPFLRWKWKSQVIASGYYDDGYGEVLWIAPSDEGVYTISLELFPTAPTADAAQIKSSLILSADIYVSAAAKAAAWEMGPRDSYYALYRLQANLKNTGNAVKRAESTEGTLVGSPRIIPTLEGFGYRLAKGDGISLPWIVIPAAGDPAPFSVSLGLRLEADPGDARVLTVTSADGESRFLISISNNTPVLTVSTADKEVTVASSTVLKKDQRHMISLSLTPRKAGGWTVQWFLDGIQTDAVKSDFSLMGFKDGGTTLIGGTDGFTGTVDCFGVFCKDARGTASPDPGLFARAALQEYREALVLAEGFDGTALPDGFTGDKAVLDSGLLTIPAGSTLSLPPLTLGSEGIDADVTVSGTPAPRAAVLIVSRKDDPDAAPLASAEIAVQNGVLSFGLKDKSLAYTGADGKKNVKLQLPLGDEETLVFSLQPSAGAAAPLVLDRILILKEKE